MNVDGEVVDHNICLFNKSETSFFATFTVNFFRANVIIFSIIVQLLYEQLIKIVGYENLTSRHVSVLFAVAVIFFSAWGLVYLIGAINTPDNRIDFKHNFGKVLYAHSLYSRGLYNDFNMEWCTDIGVQITKQLLVVIAIFSGKLGAGALIRYCLKARDQKTFRNTSMLPNETQRKSIWHYYDLYLGPHFELAVQYSMIIAVNLISLLYAAALPHIFIIGLIVLCFIYVMDRVLIAYSYR